jgi:hypothetical protein
MSTYAPSPATALYLSSLSDDLRADFQTALQATGLEGEIALLRVHIMKLNQREPDNIKLILRAVHMIERLVKCGLQIDQQNAHNDNYNPAAHPPTAVSPAAATKLVSQPASIAPGPGNAVDPLHDHTVLADAVDFADSVAPADPQPAPARTKWPTSAVAKKAPSARLPVSAHFLFHKKKHKKH